MAQIIKTNKLTWNPQDAYKKVTNEINKWPDWEKQAYNEMFAVSTHAKRLDVNYEIIN